MVMSGLCTLVSGKVLLGCWLVQAAGSGVGVPERKLRGRNERLWPENAPQMLQRTARMRDPAAPQLNSPWTLLFDRNGAPRTVRVPSPHSAAVSGLSLVRWAVLLLFDVSVWAQSRAGGVP
jgi:hypothetical protein